MTGHFEVPNLVGFSLRSSVVQSWTGRAWALKVFPKASNYTITQEGQLLGWKIWVYQTDCFLLVFHVSFPTTLAFFLVPNTGHPGWGRSFPSSRLTPGQSQHRPQLLFPFFNPPFAFQPKSHGWHKYYPYHCMERSSLTSEIIFCFSCSLTISSCHSSHCRNLVISGAETCSLTLSFILHSVVVYNLIFIIILF